MYRLRLAVALALCALALTTVPAVADEKPMALGKRGEVELVTSARVGSTLLAPGHYRFQHEMTTDGKHLLVIRSRPTDTSVARVACDVVPLEEKVSGTELHSRTGADGVREITQIRIAGEKAGHVIALAPTP